MKIYLIVIMILMSFSNLYAQSSNIKKKVLKSEKEWKDFLNDEEYRVLRQKGTEAPYSGIYNMHFESGIYRCKGCKTELFNSSSKFKSSCGWPSFDISIFEKVIEKKDFSNGMIRTEILCANCNGHLGHVFNDGPTKTGLRYCVNSISIDFVKE